MSRRGFTLVEMLVVIAIILVLASLSVGLGVRIVEDARYKNTLGLVMNLDRMCSNYYMEEGHYPPNDRNGSASLHHHLGRDRETYRGGEILRGKPYLEFRQSWLRTPGDPDSNPSPIVDAWGQEIGYAVPGAYNLSGVDIWSRGRNGVADMDPYHPNFDDVNTWTQDN